MGTPWGPQGVGRDRNITEAPRSHLCHSPPCSLGKNWTLLVGRAPVTPALTPSLPAPCCRQRPQQRCHSALVERSPGPLPLPPRAKNQLPGEGPELPPRDAKGRQTKGAGGRRSGTVPGPGRNLRPRDGPRSAGGSLQMAMAVSRAAVPGLSHGLIPARGRRGAMLGNQW